MAQPSIQTSNPAAGAVDVFLNVPLYVTFASPGLNEDSVNLNSCVLVNVGTQDTVPLKLSYNSSTRVLTATPVGTLAESTVYALRFPGTDIAISSSYVIKESGTLEALTETVEVSFTTGIRAYIDDSIITKEATNLSLEGDINLPTHVKALGPFAIEKTLPKNNSYDVAGSLDGNNKLYLKFNKTLSGSLLTDEWLSVDLYPILDFTGFYASGDNLAVNLSGYVAPTMTGLSYSGQYLYAHFSGPLPQNAGVAVTVGELVTATDGSEFGPNEYKLTFTTTRYPNLGGVHWLKTELQALSKELTNDYLSAVILKNSIRFYYRTISLPSPSIWLSNKWVIYTSLIDVLDDLDLNKTIVAGSRRSLGDFSVGFDVAIGQATLKQKRAQDELEDIDKALFLTKSIQRIDRWIFVENRPNPREWFNISGRIFDNRFVYYQRNAPQANIDLNRTSRNINPWYFI